MKNSNPRAYKYFAKYISENPHIIKTTGLAILASNTSSRFLQFLLDNLANILDPSSPTSLSDTLLNLMANPNKLAVDIIIKIFDMFHSKIYLHPDGSELWVQLLAHPDPRLLPIITKEPNPYLLANPNPDAFNYQISQHNTQFRAYQIMCANPTDLAMNILKDLARSHHPDILFDPEKLIKNPNPQAYKLAAEARLLDDPKNTIYCAHSPNPNYSQIVLDNL